MGAATFSASKNQGRLMTNPSYTPQTLELGPSTSDPERSVGIYLLAVRRTLNRSRQRSVRKLRISRMGPWTEPKIETQGQLHTYRSLINSCGGTRSDSFCGYARSRIYSHGGGNSPAARRRAL